MVFIMDGYMPSHKLVVQLLKYWKTISSLQSKLPIWSSVLVPHSRVFAPAYGLPAIPGVLPTELALAPGTSMLRYNHCFISTYWGLFHTHNLQSWHLVLKSIYLFCRVHLGSFLSILVSGLLGHRSPSHDWHKNTPSL